MYCRLTRPDAAPAAYHWVPPRFSGTRWEGLYGFHRADPKVYKLYLRSVVIKCLELRALVHLVNFTLRNSPSKFASQSGETMARKTGCRRLRLKIRISPTQGTSYHCNLPPKAQYVAFLHFSPRLVYFLPLGVEYYCAE